MVAIRCIRFDPFEGTASVSAPGRSSPLGCCIRFDPFEGTARRGGPVPGWRGFLGCIRFDPFEGTARSRLACAESITVGLH